MTQLKVLPDLTALVQDATFRQGVLRCVRCSICVPQCPSYAVFRNEADSPRGRVQLMRASMEGRLKIDAAFEQHMDRCVGCRGCEDVCPSAVPFGHLIDRTREVLATTAPNRTRKRVVRMGLRLLGHTVLLLWLVRLLRVVQWLRLDRAAKAVVGLVSRKAAARLAKVPRVAGTPFDPRRIESAAVPTVQLFSGCIMPAALGTAQRASLQVLEQSGHAVAVPATQGCCGALHQHAGEREAAAALARANIEAFGSGTEPISVSSAGCGLAMKEYGKLLADDPVWAARASAFASRVRDLEELAVPQARPRSLRVVVQESCHHRNVQRIRGRAVPLLQQAGYVDSTTLPIGSGCCGSGGIFGALQPEAANQLRGTLLDSIEESGCDVVASSNPGCLMFIRAGLEERGSHIKAQHLAELLTTVGAPPLPLAPKEPGSGE